METANIDALLKKPLWQMTGEELVDLIRSTTEPTVELQTPQHPQQTKVFEAGKYVFGLRGIRELFGVGHNTAQRYKNTFLQPAVLQRGKKIMVDREHAMQLFAEHQKKDMNS